MLLSRRYWRQPRPPTGGSSHYPAKRSYLWPFSLQNLVARPEILVQPVQRLLGQIVDRNKITGIIKEQFILAFSGSEPIKERFLRLLQRTEEVVAPIQHQHRLLYAWQKVDGIRLSKRLLEIEPTQRENAYLDSRFHSGYKGSHCRTPANPVEG